MFFLYIFYINILLTPQPINYSTTSFFSSITLFIFLLAVFISSLFYIIVFFVLLFILILSRVVFIYSLFLLCLYFFFEEEINNKNKLKNCRNKYFQSYTIATFLRKIFTSIQYCQLLKYTLRSLKESVSIFFIYYLFILYFILSSKKKQRIIKE